MPAIASLEILRVAQKDLLEATDLDELKGVFKKWRRIGWKDAIGRGRRDRRRNHRAGEL